jgi:hypothetical protein
MKFFCFPTADDQVENDDTSSSSSGIGMGISGIGMGTNYHHLHKNGDAHHQVSFKEFQGQIYL